MRRLAVASLLLLGCSPASPARPRSGRPVAPARRHASISEATRQAKAAFDAAARTGDASRIAATFAENALLITATGDSIRGRFAIARYLAELTPTALSARFVYARDGAMKRCVGGALEHLVFTAYVENSSQRSDTLPGSVTVLWRWDSTGHLRVFWAAQVERNRRSRVERSLCDAVRDSVSQAWRYSVTLFPIAALASTESKGDFESALRTRGWTDVTCSCYGPTRPTPLSEWSWLVPPSLMGVEYRVNRRVSAEFIAGRIPQGSTLGAHDFSNSDHEEARLAYSGVFVAAIFSYEVLGFHFGIGPALQRTHWTLTDSLRRSGGYPTFVKISQSTVPVGIVADVKYRTLVDDRTLFIVRAQLRRFATARTPGSATFPPAAIGQGSAFIGAGFGVVF